MQAQFTLSNGQKMSLTGFQAVDRKKLKALPPDTLAQLAGTDELELIYLHLQSLRNFVSVKDKLVLSVPEPAPADTAPAAEEREAAAAE